MTPRHSSPRPFSRALVAGFGLALSMTGCGGATSSPPSPFAAATAAAESESTDGSPDEIVRAEILERATTDLTAMALIRRLRPGWLRTRGRNTFGDSSAMYPVVYIDEIRHGGLSTLNQIPSSEILRIEFFSTADATTRWGTGHPSGVINVETGR